MATITATTLAALKVYLGPDQTYTDEEIGEAWAAESAAQQRVTDPSRFGYTEDLRAALYRRVARHLVLKYKPLGYEMGADGGLSYISSHDSEIRRLEAPYRVMPVR